MTVKQLRNQLGFTQKALADASCVNIRFIQKIESGEYSISNITLKNAVSVAQALHITAEKLLSCGVHND